MDNPTRSISETIAEQIAALEAAKTEAEDRLSALTMTCELAITNLTNALVALTDPGTPVVQPAQEAKPAPIPASPAELKPAPAMIDAAVLRILHDPPTGGGAMRVSTITSALTKMEGFGAVDGRAVSQSLQRLHKANLGAVAVRPTTPKGYWIAADLKGMRPAEQPAENGTHAEHHVVEEHAPEDDAAALEEAGVVRGDAWPSDGEYGTR
jgi:hypothetical protein